MRKGPLYLLHSFMLMSLYAVLSLPTSHAQPAPDEVETVLSYEGRDREQRLLEGARKEGTVVIYTSLNLKDSVPITEAFEKKYPGVKVTLWRAGSEKVLNRTVTEARAGRYSPDVIETNGPEMEALYREQILTPFFSPHFKDIPDVAFPEHRHYVADRFNFFVLGYNTDLVKEDEVPGSYDDLLDPRWHGKVAIEAGDSDWFAAVVKDMGEEKGLEYFRKLAATKPQIRTGHTLIAELLAAGEMPMAATVYNQNVERLRLKGAPVGWKPLAPTFGRPNAIGIAAHAPHPHAALLFTDFMLSREGQELIKARNRVPSSNAVDSPLNKFPYKMIDPVIVLDEARKWQAIWEDLFLKEQAASKQG